MARNMEPRIATCLCRLYGLGEALAWTPLAGTRNRNWVVEATSGKWFVRQRFAGYAAPERIAFDHWALDFLARRGVPVVPPLRTPQGETYRLLEEQVWEVYRFVSGDPFPEGRLEEVRALGDALGRFHQAGEGFPIRYDKLGLRGETDPGVMLEQAARIETESSDCTRGLQRYRKWIADAHEGLPDAAFLSLPHTVVHGDVQPANLLVKDHRIAALVDPDWCAWRARVYDLAFAMVFCCSTHETPIQGEDVRSLTQSPYVEDNLAAAFLEAYETRAQPLREVERAALPPQIVLSWCHSRIAGSLKVDPAARARFLSREPNDIGNLIPHLPAVHQSAGSSRCDS